MNRRSHFTRRRLLLPLAALLLAGCASGGGRREVVDVPGRRGDLPISPAVRAGNLLFLSGQIGIRPGDDRPVSGGTRDETRQALDNIRTVLRRAGLDREDVVKCTVFLADMRDFQLMNDAYRDFFGDDEPPARTTVGVTGLAAGARVEIECIAATRATK